MLNWCVCEGGGRGEGGLDWSSLGIEETEWNGSFLCHASLTNEEKIKTFFGKFIPARGSERWRRTVVPLINSTEATEPLRRRQYPSRLPLAVNDVGCELARCLAGLV